MKKNNKIIIRNIHELLDEILYNGHSHDDEQLLTFIVTEKRKCGNNFDQEITQCRESAIEGYINLMEKHEYLHKNIKILFTSTPRDGFIHSRMDEDMANTVYSKLEQHGEDIHKHIKLSTLLLNIIERNIGWKESMPIYFHSEIIGSDKKESKRPWREEEYYTKMVSKLLYFSFDSSRRWFTSPQTISLYLLIIRLGFSAYKYFKNVKGLTSLHAACRFFCSNSRLDDAEFVGDSHRCWIKFLENRSAIYKGLKIKDLFTYKGDAPFYGIQALSQNHLGEFNDDGDEDYDKKAFDLYSNTLMTIQKRFNRIIS